jgi:periplasmic iron binding protein
MQQRWIGPIVVLLILGGVASILLLNLNLKGTNPRPTDTSSPSRSQAQPPASSVRRPAGFREYPIGDEVERHQMRIAAVWLPPVQMDGMAGPAPSDMIHIEADIHATEGNKNGCPKDEFVPYLTVRYAIVPEGPAAKSVEPIRDTLIPMVARDGWHYGASILMPKAGRYKLTYTIEPPSAGRHVDPVTGVDPWWKPFEVSFDWDYPGPP